MVVTVVAVYFSRGGRPAAARAAACICWARNRCASTSIGGLLTATLCAGGGAGAAGAGAGGDRTGC